MENSNENISKLMIKLKVLENKIRNLEELTDVVMDEVKNEYQKHITQLKEEKDTAVKKLLEMRGSSDN